MALIDLKDRKLIGLAALALILLGLYGGLELFPLIFSSRPQPLASGSRTGRAAFVPPSFESTGLAETAAKPAEITFEQMVGVLAPLKADPAAARFADDFIRDPRLRQIWDEAGREKSPRTFFETLRRSSEFTRLVVQHSVFPDFRRLAQQLANTPPFGDWIRQAMAVGPGINGERGAALVGDSTAMVRQEERSAPARPQPATNPARLNDRLEGNTPRAAGAHDVNPHLAPVPEIGAMVERDRPQSAAPDAARPRTQFWGEPLGVRRTRPAAAGEATTVPPGTASAPVDNCAANPAACQPAPPPPATTVDPCVLDPLACASAPPEPPKYPEPPQGDPEPPKYPEPPKGDPEPPK